MKLALSLALSFLLFTFVTKLTLAFEDHCMPVLDINYNPISPGRNYYILPANRPSGGGLRLGNTAESYCPNIVLQDKSEAIFGTPVRFSKIDSFCPSCIIFTDTPLEIEFIEKPKCAESAKWLAFDDPKASVVCVGISGIQGSTVSSTFSILQSGYYSSYRLAICDSLPYNCTMTVATASVAGEGGSRLCALKNAYFAVVFIDEGYIRSVA